MRAGARAAPVARSVGSVPEGSPSAPGYPVYRLALTDPHSLDGILPDLQNAPEGNMVTRGSVPGDRVEAGVSALASHLAAGMSSDGKMLRQTLNEGQHVAMVVTLRGGECYTILGFSPRGGIKDLDLTLLEPPEYAMPVGQDLTWGRTAALGPSPSPMCPVLKSPARYRLDVYARKGSGPVAVQLYSKQAN
jgi:hypothetical protein